MRGELVLSRQQPLHEALNKPDLWIEFRSREGKTLSISKNSIESVSEFEVAATKVTHLEVSKADPYHILGVPSGSDPATIREAYLTKVRLYHPDHYASVSLPQEVSEYIQSMFVMVREAFEEVGSRNRRSSETEAA